MRVGVLVEHRQANVRDITFELLTKARELGDTIAIILSQKGEDLAQKLKGFVSQVVTVDDDRFTNFNPEYYRIGLKSLVETEKLDLILLGQTAFGVDLAPALAQDLKVPIATDCIEVKIEGDRLITTRNIYGGKINCDIAIKRTPAVLTLRPATFQPQRTELPLEIKKTESSLREEIDYRRFLEFVEAKVGEVDITKSDVIVAVGRGIREEKNLPMIQELADALGGVVACTRPIVDSGWLPKDRQVGSSGKTVKPKLYLAIGVSGAFQHTMGMRGSGTIIAVNKDPEAPIFNEADYGIVDDLFKVVPILKEKIKELRA
ncbi:MAG TPA: electron transfer flavoprotein subunit alpha/FixB family protein [bacterium (Candidatus Stahlbacteria)]|nr:electron transfer flavoprotein subunit alpha/FixB family protein [Candidatus Stahlbacteria bacterium]